MSSLVYSVLVLLLFECVVCTSRVDPLVSTNVGLLRGLKASDGNYAMFLGIPYAKVDDKNPFGPSTPYPKFNETFEAFNDSAICPQKNQLTGVIGGTLDCLNLNIYVPDTASSTNKLPVMVWIYGGRFHHGLAGRLLYGPKYLVKHEVIIVTLNYRVNAFGFMCLDIPEVPGNQGLKDQVLAFKWVKDNIAEFGGDPDKITLFGESAGGHSIDLHLLFAKETHFNKVILESGSSVASTVLYDADKTVPLKLAQHLGYETKQIYEALDILSNADTNSVVTAFDELNIEFKPCVEKEFDGIESLITRNWKNLQAPIVKDIPVLLGFNEHEMAVTYMNKDENYYQNLDVVTTHLKQLFNVENNDTFTEMKDIVTNYYFGDEKMSKALRWSLINYDSDVTYIDPIHRTLRNYLKSGAKTIFLYMFSYVGGRNAIVYEDDSCPLCCASHADELYYLWDTSGKPEPTEQDRLVIDRMTTMWTNFAKYSDPTPEVTELLPVKWLPLTNDTYNYLSIDRQLTLGRRPLHQRMAFWELFYRLYGGYQK